MKKLTILLLFLSINLIGNAEALTFQNGKTQSNQESYVSELPDCKSSSTYKHNCIGTFTFASGDKYVGEWKDGKYSGQGTFTFASGDKYVGEWKDDKYNGQGTYTFGHSSEWAGDKYVGEYKNGKRHGQGTFTFASGNKYVGEWKDDKYNGQGTYTFASGNKYVGEWKDDKYNGQGTYTYADGTIESGIWEDDELLDVDVNKLPDCKSSSTYKHNCFGTFTFASGNKYVGEFKNGKRHGQGTFTYAGGDGEKYVGEFKNDKYNGQGTYTYADGDKYVGEHKNDKRHGQGTYTFASGDKYVGEFKNGKKHGQGTFTYASGDKYVGEWKDDKIHGQGTFTFASGNKYVGEFKNGKKHGQGTFTYASGDKYVGEHKNDKRHGQGTYTFASGDKYVGEFKNGKYNGQGTYTYADGTIESGIWEDDELLYANNEEIYSASSGSGFAVTSDGYVVTNYHVVEGCTDVKIHDKGRKIKASIVTYDPSNDIALLKGNFIPRKFYPLSRESPELLTEVFVAGHPFGKRISASVKVTKGIVSSLSGVGNNFSNFQIDAALQPGNSGGPIMNDKGNVVGVAVAKLKRDWGIKEFDAVPELVNFGVKSSVVIGILESENINLIAPYKEAKSQAELGSMITDGTYYLSCWMTEAQIEKVKKTKVIFQ
jgi:hypothetical protein